VTSDAARWEVRLPSNEEMWAHEERERMEHRQTRGEKVGDRGLP
jgi:hypothetical protein